MAAQRIAVLIGDFGNEVHLYAIPPSWDSDDVHRFISAQDCDLATVTTLQDVPEEY